MAQKTFPCGDNPLLTIRAEKNVSIKGDAVSEVQITIEDLNDLVVTENHTGKNGLIIISEDDCALLVPENAQVAIDEVGGNVSVSALKGNLYLTQIDGNASLSSIGDAAIKSVDGNCRIDSAGNVTIEYLDGNLKGTEVKGLLSAIHVDGNIKIGSTGSVEKLTADGNIEVGILEIKNDMEISADGNIYLTLPENPGFILDAAVGGNFTARFGGERRNFSGVLREVKFGDGGPRVKINAGGNVYLSDSGTGKARSMPGETEGVYAGVMWGEMNERIQKRINEHTRKAMRRTEAIQRKAERRVREAMKSVEGFDFSRVINESLRSQGWPFGAEESTAYASTSAPEYVEEDLVEEREKVTDAERMLILNMLHDKKINAEEAERLLDALEGNFHNQ